MVTEGFAARYPGVCPECDGQILGHLVHRNQFGQLTHDVCPTTAIDREEAKPACTECFIIHPEGECP